jgi:hypothetical protein
LWQFGPTGLHQDGVRDLEEELWFDAVTGSSVSVLVWHPDFTVDGMRGSSKYFAGNMAGTAVIWVPVLRRRLR